jgi:hypothetical protein
MEKTFCKTKISTITLILVLTASAMLISLPITNAQETETKETYAFVGANPNPVGVGQDVLLHFGITDPLTLAYESWEGITVTVKLPNGNTETLGPYETDSTGGAGDIYTPNMVGEYVLQTHFPEQWYNFTGFTMFGPVETHTLYMASDSEELTLVVQAEPIPDYPGVPLPAEYWNRPIDSQAREWYTIAGSWPYDPDNRIATDNDYAPETAHILWTEPLTMGGLVGGDVGLAESINQGPVGFGTGDAYEGIWSSRFIIAGKLYYATYAAGMILGSFPEPVEYHCVDLHTGEELWTKVFMDNQTIAFGQIYYYQGFNYMGAFAYLWVTEGGFDFFTGTYLPGTWTAFNAYTGNWAFTIENVPSGTTLRDSNGGLYVLHVDQMNHWMGLWSMPSFIQASATGYYEYGGSWGNVVNGMTFDAGADTAAAAGGWDWNVTIPAELQGSVVASFLGDRVIGSNLVSGFGGSVVPSSVQVWGISLKQGEEGQVLFNESWLPPSDWISGNQSISWAAWSAEDKVGVLWSKELRKHYGVSLETGEMIWTQSDSQYYLDIYEGTMLTSHLIAYGRLYACGVAGILYCYNVTTGDLLWTYEARDPYTESPFSSNWWLGITFITEGKLYIGSAEHSGNQPLPRGAPFLCINATTGAVIWRANGLFRQTGWGGLAIIGDSIIATMDTYDQRVYAIGKGPSALTVEMTTDVTTLGNSILVKGKVTDVSPGTKDLILQNRFPNGVPAVADESMSDWMLHVYKQYPCPTDVKGVDVFVKILDPNGDYYSTIVTADGSGAFSMAWIPQIVGMYQVTVLFQGSASYYPSWATTSFVIDQAPDYPEAPTVEEIAAESASRTIAMLPPYPDVPTQEQIAADAASRTIAMLPPYPQPTQCPEIPAYPISDIVIIILVVVVLVIGLYCCFMKKQK